jgi:hypothetical protein
VNVTVTVTVNVIITVTVTVTVTVTMSVTVTVTTRSEWLFYTEIVTFQRGHAENRLVWDKAVQILHLASSVPVAKVLIEA